jgi:glycosyltransferase involved in cell wall biosynthesis
MTSKKPLISIITINYNNAEGLKRTIASVINQSFKDIEYIVIDGGSTDESNAVIAEFNDGIHFHISEKDSGIYNAMNKGIKNANGSYLLFLNSGDSLIDDNIINDVVYFGLDKDLIYGNLLFFTAEKEWIWNMPDQLSFETFYNTTIAHPSTFIKKSLFDEIGFYDEELSIVSDWKFFTLACAKYNCTYKHISKVISRYSFDGLSSKAENLVKIESEREKVLNKEFSFFIKDYKSHSSLKKEMKKINYFIKIRRFFKGK